MKLPLSNKDPFRLGFVAFVVIPGGVAIPLSESQSPQELWPRLVISIASLAVALGAIWILKPLYKTSLASPWLTPAIAAIAGALRGVVIWQLLDQFSLSGSDLWSRIFFGSVSWTVSLTLAAMAMEVVRSLLRTDRELRVQLIEAEEQSQSLDQQLRWLLDAKVRGIDSELAKELAELVSKLNDGGNGPGAFREIARELRHAARDRVRTRSIAEWGWRGELQPSFPKIFSSPPNPLLAAMIFSLTGGMNNFRLFGFDPITLVPLLGGVVMYLWLLAVRALPAGHLFTSIPVGLVTLLSLLPLGYSIDSAALAVLPSVVWSFAIVLFSSVLSLIDRGDLRSLFKANEALREKEAKINWLSLQLESQRLEIAKYLHAILQTRLMSYAIRMEGDGLSESELQDLTQLLQNPMGQFGLGEKGLQEGLAELKHRWQSILEISEQLESKYQQLDSATLQVIQEALANCVRHGQADRAQIVVLDAKNRTIRIEDNGIGPTAGLPGLGSRVFDSLTDSWELVPGYGGGAVFQAVLATNANS